MQRALGLFAIAVVFACVGCGSQPQAARSRTYTTELALTQVEADLGVGAILVRPVESEPEEIVDDVDVPCTVNGLSFSSCTITRDQPAELHVQTTLCELNPNEPTEARFFVECRPSSTDIVRPVEIPHCPGHG